jgi:pimeloyl-ACP methyl ester carboxylesterase
MRQLGIERPHLVGHSMGGQIAVHVAADAAPLGSLTLVDAAGLPRPRTVREMTRFMAGVLPPRAWGVPHFIPTIWIDALRAGPRSLLRAGLNLLSDDVTPLLPRIRVPTLVVWGALDPLIPVEYGRRMADAIPGARFVVMEDAAHNVMCDRPHEFNHVLLDFLARA